MPQTGTTNGHAHMYDLNAKRTKPFDGHDHEIPTSGNRTGPGGEDDHRHVLPDRP